MNVRRPAIVGQLLFTFALRPDAAGNQRQLFAQTVTALTVHIRGPRVLIRRKRQRAAFTRNIDEPLGVDIALAAFGAQRHRNRSAGPFVARPNPAIDRVLIHHLEYRVIERLVVDEGPDGETGLAEIEPGLVL